MTTLNTDTFTDTTSCTTCIAGTDAGGTIGCSYSGCILYGCYLALAVWIGIQDTCGMLALWDEGSNGGSLGRLDGSENAQGGGI